MPYRPPLYGIFWAHIFCKYGGWSELFSGNLERESSVLNPPPFLDLHPPPRKCTNCFALIRARSFRGRDLQGSKLKGNFTSENQRDALRQDLAYS